MLIKLFFIFTFLSSTRLFAQSPYVLIVDGPNSHCPSVDWTINPQPIFSYRDNDLDHYMGGEETGHWLCFTGSLDQARADGNYWLTPNEATKNPDGTFAIDCNDNDPSRFMLVKVWPDADRDTYAPE